jgi:hypothetical protein
VLELLNRVRADGWGLAGREERQERRERAGYWDPSQTVTIYTSKNPNAHLATCWVERCSDGRRAGAFLKPLTAPMGISRALHDHLLVAQRLQSDRR